MPDNNSAQLDLFADNKRLNAEKELRTAFDQTTQLIEQLDTLHNAYTGLQKEYENEITRQRNCYAALREVLVRINLQLDDLAFEGMEPFEVSVSELQDQVVKALSYRGD